VLYILFLLILVFLLYNSVCSHHNAARFLIQIRSYPSSFLQAQNLGCQRATAAICPQGASILIQRSYVVVNSQC
jgi:hypothetical protein